MPKVRLTAAAVERLKAPAEGQAEFFDASYPGLALRITAKGVRSWVYFGRVNGKLKRATLGRYPALSLAEARRKAGETAEAMAGGTDPTTAKRAARLAAQEADRDTVEAVVAEWLKRDQADNRSAAEVQRIMDRDVLPRWRDRRIEEVARRDVIELLDAIADRGAVTMARRVHAHLHRLFRWSVARGLITANPMADLPKPGREVKRDRVLDDDELREVWQAAGALGWPFGPAVQLLILTGARRDEIGALEWAEVDKEKATFRLTGARTKNGQPHTIPLSTLAQEIVATLPKVEGANHVFTVTGETPISGWSRAKAKLDTKIAESRIEAATEAGDDPEKVEGMDAWRLHDLRRSAASGLQRLGFRLEVIEAVLGHVSGSRAGIVGVYQRHAFDDEKRAALEAWAGHLAKVIGAKPAKVVKLRRLRI